MKKNRKTPYIQHLIKAMAINTENPRVQILVYEVI